MVNHILKEISQRTCGRRVPHAAGAEPPGQFRGRVPREPVIRVVPGGSLPQRVGLALWIALLGQRPAGHSAGSAESRPAAQPASQRPALLLVVEFPVALTNTSASKP